MDALLKQITKEYNFELPVLEEFETLISAWRSIGMTDKEIKQELEDYDIRIV